MVPDVNPKTGEDAKMAHRKTLRLGTISEATLRPEDVVPALLDALATIRLCWRNRG
jgi:hypothetical protein